MRRPALYIVCAFTAGVILCHSLQLESAHFFVLILPAAVVWLRRRRNAAVIMCAVILGGVYADICEERRDPLPEMAGKEIILNGEIIQALKKAKDRYYIVIKAGDDSRCRVGIYSEFKDFKSCVGKKVSVKGEIKLPEEKRNPGCFDYRAYLKTQGINTVMSLSYSPETDEIISPLMNKIWTFRTGFQDALSRHIDGKGLSVTVAMIFGDTSAMDEETYEEFQKNGTAHVLAVSGMHISLIYGFFCIVTGGRRKPKVNVVIGCILLVYMVMVGFMPSVVRAVIMILVHIFGDLTHRRYDLLSAGAVSALIMMIQNPLCIFAAGFQMSYLAVCILAVAMEALKNRKINKVVKDMILPSVIIQAAMTPYIAYNFNYVSLGGFIANIPVVFVSGLIVPMGMAAIFCHILTPFLSAPVFHMLGYLSELMEKCNSLTYMKGALTFTVTSPAPVFVLMFYICFFFFLSDGFYIWMSRRNTIKILSVLILFTGMATAVAAYGSDGFAGAKIVFVDVGQGSCVHVKTPGGKHILIDAGGSADYDVGKKTVMPYLLKNGCDKVDLAVVTHLDNDHYGGMISLAKEGMINQLVTFCGNEIIEERIANETGLPRERIVYASAGDRIDAGDGVHLDMLWPDEESPWDGEADALEGQNEYSLVIKISYGDMTVLATGDIGQETESLLWDRYDLTGEAESRVMAVPHHGSRYSSSEEFVDMVSPKLAVVQVGRNFYGHPAPEAMRVYKSRGIKLLRNDRRGAIGIFPGRGKPEYVTVK